MGTICLILMYIVAIDFAIHLAYFAKTGKGKNAEILAPYKAMRKGWK